MKIRKVFSSAAAVLLSAAIAAVPCDLSAVVSAEDGERQRRADIATRSE